MRLGKRLQAVDRVWSPPQMPKSCARRADEHLPIKPGFSMDFVHGAATALQDT